MDGQHQYEINLKKDELFIGLSSDDVYFISKQMDKWFRILLDDSYVPVSLPPWPQPAAAAPAPTVSVSPEPEAAIPATEPAPPAAAVPEPLVAAEPEPLPVTVPPVQTAPEPPETPVLPTRPTAVVPPAPEPEAVPVPVPEPVAEATDELPTFESNQALADRILNSFEPESPEPAINPAAAASTPSLQDVLAQAGQPNLPDFLDQQVQQSQPEQPVVSSILDAIPATPQSPIPAATAAVPEAPALLPLAPESIPQTAPPQPVAVGAPAAPPTEEDEDFEAVMNTLMRDFEDKPEPEESPAFPAGGGASAGNARARLAPDLSGITSLADLCDRANAANSEDYLLLAAYYLTQLERQETFSLKKVNSVLVKSGLTPVNHSVLETVLTNGYLAMVPDLTGTAEVTEYKISMDGQAAALALL